MAETTNTTDDVVDNTVVTWEDEDGTHHGAPTSKGYLQSEQAKADAEAAEARAAEASKASAAEREAIKAEVRAELQAEADAAKRKPGQGQTPQA